jgi:regulator of protease activity HflC (stomatin/prohibitin superfamily)
VIEGKGIAPVMGAGREYFMLEIIGQMLGPAGVALVIAAVFLISGIKILKEYDRAVIFRLGRMVPTRGPGITYVIPLIEKMVRVDLRTVTMDVPPQDVITRDNVSVKVSAVLYFRVIDPNRAIREVANYLFATSQLAQVELRSVCGQAELDELLSQRDRLNSRIQEILDAETEPWGIKVVLVELKHIDLPQEMQRAMAKQAEAERERRAKIIHAEGEFQASQKLADAAEIIAKQPTAILLRFLQSLVQVAAENNHTVVVPIPVDMMTLLLDGIKAWSNVSASNTGSQQPAMNVKEA